MYPTHQRKLDLSNLETGDKLVLAVGVEAEFITYFHLGLFGSLYGFGYISWSVDGDVLGRFATSNYNITGVKRAAKSS